MRDLGYAISRAGGYWPASGGFVIAIILRRIPGGLGRTEIVTLIDVVHCANVLGEKKVQCPVKCYTDLLVQAGQFTQVNRPPHPPGEEAREIEAKDPRHTHPTPD